MDADKRWRMIESVQTSGHRIGLVTTGGGSLLLTWLLNHPGASRAIVDAQIPYHPEALSHYLETRTPHHVAEPTAVLLAAQAQRRVLEFCGGGERAVGFGCTAALATRRARRGQDRAAIAVMVDATCQLCTVTFLTRPGKRLEQEEWLSQVGLQLLLRACAPGEECRWPPGVRVKERTISFSDPLSALYDGELRVVECSPAGRLSLGLRRRHRLLLPGSFHPLHAGHEGMLRAAEKASGRRGAYELSIENVDKPALARAEVERRLSQFAGKRSVYVTRAATFAEKAQLFPGAVFVVGYDTAQRLLDPGYYQGPQAMTAALEDMAASNCSYLVAGRLSDGRFRECADLALPAAQRHLFRGLPQAEFRLDISSSQIRAGDAAQGGGGWGGS